MKVKGFFGLWFAICAVLGIGSVAFVVWVIIKLMSYFGVI